MNHASANPCNLFAARRGWAFALLGICVGLGGLTRGARAADFAALDTAAAVTHDDAQRAWRLAHERAEKARAEATTARRQLDDFVARHLEEHHARGAAPLVQVREAMPKLPLHPERERLNTQLQELRTHRDQLLDHLTRAHPEVSDVEQRIVELTQRLSALGGPTAESEQPLESPAEQTDEVTDRQLAERLNAERAWHQETAELYEPLFERWQAAEQASQSAIRAENRAAEHLAAVKSAAAPAVAADLPELPPTTQKGAYQRDERGSQPLALTALVLALAVAALAAIKLARSSSDPIFASADEVAAALALPMVGILPAAEALEMALPAARPLPRSTRLLGEIVLAVIVFGAVAYLVQSTAIF